MSITQPLIGLLIVLLVAQFATAQSQPLPDTAGIWRTFAEKLEAGAFVEVSLKVRTKVKGHYIQVAEDTLLLKPKTRIPVPIRTFQFSDIESITRRNEGWSPGAKVLTGTVVAVGSILLLAAVALAAAWD